jgi:hypothetical protein
MWTFLIVKQVKLKMAMLWIAVTFKMATRQSPLLADPLNQLE